MKHRLIQVGLSLALLALLIQIVLMAPSQIRDAETKASILPTPEVKSVGLTKDGEVIDQSITGMRMIETQEGKKEWQLWSAKANSIKAKDIWELEDVKIVFFSESGVTFTVTGKMGVVQAKSKNLRVEGDVVTRSSNGYVFRTESMEYVSVGRELTAVNQVDMTGPRDAKGHAMHLTGRGMKAKLQEANMEILNDVKAEKGLDQERKFFIRSRRSVFSGQDKTARFFGDVVLDIDSMRITGPEAQFDYDSKRDVMKTVMFSGGARVSDADKWATSQNLKVDFDANKFVFRGSPRVVQNNDELRGDEIIFIDGGKQVQVRGARAKVDEKRLEKKR